jgi:hypothetical protein
MQEGQAAAWVDAEDAFDPESAASCGVRLRQLLWVRCQSSSGPAKSKPYTFQPLEPEFTLKEFCEFETPVEQVDSLLFVGARMLDCLVARATSRAMSLASLSLQMQLEGCSTHHGVIRPALASTDRKFLLKLLKLEFAAHPPQAAVLALTRSHFLRIEGLFQNQDSVIHVKAQRILPLDTCGADIRSHDFH